MADSVMLNKAKDFAVTIVNLCRDIKETRRESVLTNQLLRSGTSIGANIHIMLFCYSESNKIDNAVRRCLLNKTKPLY